MEDRSAHRTSSARAWLGVAAFGYLFFLAIDLIGQGMKHSFAPTVQAFLAEQAEAFTPLRSFVLGLLGTVLAQSSSAMTSMIVVLSQEGVLPLLLASGLIFGSNLGTSVTSSLVAFAADAPASTGRPLRDLGALLFRPRTEAFRRAVGTAVVHDFFNILMVTSLLLAVEIPTGWILGAADLSARHLGAHVTDGDRVLAVIGVLSPSTWTRPVTTLILDGPVWLVPAAWSPPLWLGGAVGVTAGLPLLFVSLRGFTRRTRERLLAHLPADDLPSLGQQLLGTRPIDAFLRGLVLTILVQSSSATTSLVVPLAALGLFDVRRIFPFILGTNLGTTVTALLAATSGAGEPGFHAGLTVALSHLYLNALGVLLAVSIPGLPDRVIAAADTLATGAT